jgi:hypothetical protein
MNSQEFARRALVLIYQTTTTAQPAFDINLIIRGTQETLPDVFEPGDLVSYRSFITALETVAHVLPPRELQGVARLAQTMPSFETAMRHHYVHGELPVKWAHWYKEFKSDPRTFELFYQGMKDLGIEAE